MNDFSLQYRSSWPSMWEGQFNQKSNIWWSIATFHAEIWNVFQSDYSRTLSTRCNFLSNFCFVDFIRHCVDWKICSDDLNDSELGFHQLVIENSLNDLSVRHHSDKESSIISVSCESRAWRLSVENKSFTLIVPCREVLPVRFHPYWVIIRLFSMITAYPTVRDHHGILP